MIVFKYYYNIKYRSRTTINLFSYEESHIDSTVAYYGSYTYTRHNVYYIIFWLPPYSPISRIW